MTEAQFLEVMGRIAAWEADHPGLSWTWADVRIHPRRLMALVIEGRVKVMGGRASRQLRYHSSGLTGAA